MIGNILKKIFGSRNDRLLRQYAGVVARINELEKSTAALSDEQLAGRTVEFKQRVASGISEGLDRRSAHARYSSSDHNTISHAWVPR